MRYKKEYWMILFFALSLAAVGICIEGPGNILPGLRKIILMQDVLITDYVETAGPAAAFINASLVTIISAGLLYFSGDVPNGFTITDIGLMSGFALFGKNIFNIWPIILGTFLYSRIQKEPFSKYVTTALLATALSPLVSFMAFGSRHAHPLGGILIGVLIGLILPPLSAYTYKVQNGMNLYNMGFACGMLAMMIVPMLAAVGDSPETVSYWAEGYNLEFGIVLAIYCMAFIICGLFFSGSPIWAVWAGYRRILTTSGRAPSDYLRASGHGPVLVNMGVNGLVAMAYILLVGGDLNGPTLGGIFTIIGFSAFGKHLCNILPIMGGVLLGGIFMHYNVDSPSLQLAALFGTTLAPFAGVFGPVTGLVAGFLHSALVLQTGSALAGVNLYNNGFSGGLIAIVLFPVVTAIFRHRNPELVPMDFFVDTRGDKPEPLERDMDLDHPGEADGEPFPVLQQKQAGAGESSSEEDT